MVGDLPEGDGVAGRVGEAATGRRPSSRAKNQMASSPSQKAGAASRVYAAALTHRSSRRPGLRAASTPRPVPRSTATAKAAVASSTDQPRRSPMTSATGWRITVESPRSPPSAELSQSHQRLTSGRSTPRLARSWSRFSCEAVSHAVPAYALTGSKGEAAATAKTPNVTAARTGTASSTQPACHPAHLPPGEAVVHFFGVQSSTFHHGPDASPWSCGSTWVVRGPKRSFTT